MQVTAAVLEEHHKPLAVQELELDEPLAGEVLVRIVASGVCHTDAVAQEGAFPFPLPGVLGHEGSGIVEAVGPGVTKVKEGDKVIIGWPWCGECRNCQAGRQRYCLQIGPLVLAGIRLATGESALSRASGRVHSHFFGQSSFSTYSITSERQLVKVARSSTRCSRRPAPASPCSAPERWASPGSWPPRCAASRRSSRSTSSTIG